ncbi:MAG: DUF3800 domain-containing protein [Bacteroidales bacterium]|nr:DUF3800 domain-containing protein [Bacteroidales bacterium]
MQFVYIDESGTGDELIAVMVGVIADSYRMRLTKEHWSNLLSDLSEIIGRDIDEIHTRDFYSGNSPWRDLNGPQRSEIITKIFNWLRERKHSIVYTAVDKTKFYEEINDEEKYNDISTIWRFMAFHITLSLQKRFQGAIKGKKDRKVNSKGSCVLIFDNEHREESRFTELILNSPDWSDSYYQKKEKQQKLNQIIDVPHVVDSKQVGLIQLADFICFFVRKHIKLQMGIVEPAYRNEVEKVESWTELILNHSIPKNNIFMSRGRCDCAELFYKYAPETLK